MEVLEEEEEGWWKGRIGSKEGVFPSNFVEEISEEVVKAPPPHQPSPEPPAMPVADTGERWGGGGGGGGGEGVREMNV